MATIRIARKIVTTRTEFVDSENATHEQLCGALEKAYATLDKIDQAMEEKLDRAGSYNDESPRDFCASIRVMIEVWRTATDYEETAEED